MGRTTPVGALLACVALVACRDPLLGASPEGTPALAIRPSSPSAWPGRPELVQVTALWTDGR